MGGCYCWLGLGKRQHSRNGNTGSVGRSTIPDGVVTSLSLSGIPPLQLETWPSFRIGSTAWPSAFLLAESLAALDPRLPSIKGKHVVEIGAGPGVPGLVCGLLGAASVVLTDREDLVPLLARNVQLNALENVCFPQELDWDFAYCSGLTAASRRHMGHRPFEIVLAADVVYFEEQDPLMSCLEALMEPERTCLVLAYRERTCADRRYLEERILPRLREPQCFVCTSVEHGCSEIYVGRLRASGS